VTDIFEVADPWGESVRLSERRWRKLIEKREEIAPYVAEIQETIEQPWRIYEARSAPDSKAFYSQKGLVSDHPFGGCHVAVVVRYTHRPGSLATVYLPYRISGNLGRLLYPADERE
jgi:hypothetical protein